MDPEQTAFLYGFIAGGSLGAATVWCLWWLSLHLARDFARRVEKRLEEEL